jgi:hypothetical protein
MFRSAVYITVCSGLGAVQNVIKGEDILAMRNDI